MLTKTFKDQIQCLIDSILKIPGTKILTLVTEHQSSFVIDVSETGVFGYEEGHELLFKARLFSVFKSAGVLIVRQFLSTKVKRKMPNGKELWIPRKNIYGVHIVSGKWIPLSKSEVESAYCMDYRTGEPLPPEEDIWFCDFPGWTTLGLSEK